MMLYDVVRRTERVAPSGMSCAFRQFRVALRTETLELRRGWTKTSIDNQLWEVLCELLTASEHCSILTPVTDLEPEWRDMLFNCPYVDIVAQNTSLHGDYQAYICVVHKHKRPKE